MRTRKTIYSRCTAVATAAALLSGCVTMDVEEVAFAGSRPKTEASLQVAVYESPDAKLRGMPYPKEVHSRVIALDERGIVGEGNTSQWTIESLPPGRYRVELTDWTNMRGERRELSGEDETLTIQGGETTVVTFTLRDPWPVIVPTVCGIVVVAAVAAWAAKWSEGGWWERTVAPN